MNDLGRALRFLCAIRQTPNQQQEKAKTRTRFARASFERLVQALRRRTAALIRQP
jgi:hypothetical protein